ncbi:hypothetical protein EDD38_7610 [Kitasatospora cineracea]|uniref:Uncharacterized protein n=1 Tax=Kitasatospora cineracea TaxID=88074 RepID=A0A3N4R080_9ACTN|nr:hypothetical protein EDD39_7579 [Kitasatospora cineracea]RPE26973.1 hypothetical protein EDD38_7610 [Kitasatospora cineracea]
MSSERRTPARTIGSVCSRCAWVKHMSTNSCVRQGRSGMTSFMSCSASTPCANSSFDWKWKYSAPLVTPAAARISAIVAAW